MKLLTRRTARPAGVRLAPLRLDYRTNYPLSAELYIDLGEISADDQGLEVAVAAVALGAVHEGVGFDEQFLDALRRAVPRDEPGRDRCRFVPVGFGQTTLDAAHDGGRLVAVGVGEQQHELVAADT